MHGTLVGLRCWLGPGDSKITLAVIDALTVVEKDSWWTNGGLLSKHHALVEDSDVYKLVHIGSRSEYEMHFQIPRILDNCVPIQC